MVTNSLHGLYVPDISEDGGCLSRALSDQVPRYGTVRPELAYVLLLHFTFASGIGVGHAGCAEFSFLPLGVSGPVRVSVRTVTYMLVGLIGRIERIET